MKNLKVQLNKTPKGDWNISHSLGFFHSNFNPKKEAQRVAEEILNICKSQKKSILFIGLAWGYVIEELKDLDHTITKDVIFYEPIVEMYQLLQSEGRLEKLVDLGFPIYGPKDDLKKVLVNVQLFVNPTYKRVFPDLAKEIGEHLQSLSQKIDAKTSQFFLRQWTKNSFNLFSTKEKLNYLSKKVEKKDLDIVFCGASPNLIKDLEQVPKDLYTIVADTALAPLLSLGRRVDCVISVDSGYATYYHFRASKHWQKKEKFSSDMILLTWSAGLKQIPSFFKEVYYYRSSLPSDQILASGPLASCPEWRNLSRNTIGLAILFANTLGAKKLYCAGTSFLGNLGFSHVNGTGYQEYLLDKVKRNFTMYMYHSKIYTPKLSPQNKLAYEGAKELGKQLGVKIEKINSSTKINFLSQSQRKIVKKIKEQLKSQSISIDTKSFRIFLKKNEEKVKKIYNDFGLDKSVIGKYLKEDSFQID